MEMILTLIQQKLSALVPFIVLLGLLIFVHELGHFLVAKLFGVRVETFSLGFGKKILQFKRGDTTYAISLIPLGGYVKMFGDDPTATIADDQKRYSFLHKPVGQRIGIVLAGPLMNLFFAVVLFFMVAFIGTPVAAPVLGDVSEGTPAHQAGFRTGDTVLKVAGEDVSYWQQVVDRIKDNANNTLTFTVRREGSSSVEEIAATPKIVANDDVFSLQHQVGGIEGMKLYSKAPVIGITGADTVAARAGLRPLDLIEKINGEEIIYWRQLGPMLKKHAAARQLVLTVSEYQRSNEEPKPRDVVIEGWSAPENESEVLAALGIEDAELYLLGVKDGSPAQKAGIQRGDKIVEINGKAIDSWEKVIAEVSAFKKENGAIRFTIARLGERQSLEILPEMTELMNQKLQDEQRFTVGILSGVASTTAPMVTEKYTALGEAFSYSVDKTLYWTKMVVISLVKLVVGDVSPRNIAGIVTIGRVANQSYEVGLFAFLKVMAIISINLFLLNLMPIPILDGGHLLFFSLEAIRGAPLSMKKMEVAQQVGLIIMMTLMVFALFNDIRNWISSPW